MVVAVLALLMAGLVAAVVLVGSSAVVPAFVTALSAMALVLLFQDGRPHGSGGFRFRHR